MTYRAKSLLLWLAEDKRRHLVSKWSVRQVTSYGADGTVERGGSNRWLAYAELMGRGYLEDGDDVLSKGHWRPNEEGHVKAQRLLIAGKPKKSRVAPVEKRCVRPAVCRKVPASVKSYREDVKAAERQHLAAYSRTPERCKHSADGLCITCQEVEERTAGIMERLKSAAGVGTAKVAL